MIKQVLTAGALALATLGVTPAGAATVAYDVEVTHGNQQYTGVLGMLFSVNQSIDVTKLGAFDDNGDGIVGTITTEIWSRTGYTGIAKLATLTFDSTDMGTLDGGSRFKALSNFLTLASGDYAIVSYGYSADDMHGNKAQRPGAPWTTNDGGGALSFGAIGLFGGVKGNTIGDRTANGPEDQYAAGTFSFIASGSNDQSPIETSTVPVPAALPLLAGGLGIFGFVARRRRG